MGYNGIKEKGQRVDGEKSTNFEGVEDVFADAKYNKKHVSEKHKDRDSSGNMMFVLS